MAGKTSHGSKLRAFSELLCLPNGNPAQAKTKEIENGKFSQAVVRLL
jgi:hypothetical protein